MKLEGERWRTLVSTVRLGRDEFRVVRPAEPVKHAPAYLAGGKVQVIVDKAAARTFAMAWAFAMRSPRTLVYLPLREQVSACGGDEPLLDLALMHPGLGLRPSRWKDVRARLKGGRSHTVVCQGLPEPDVEPYREHHLRRDVVAQTAFIVGTPKAFAVWGKRLRRLVEECPRHMHESPGTHCCAEIDAAREWKWLHVVYCDEHRVHHS